MGSRHKITKQKGKKASRAEDKSIGRQIDWRMDRKEGCLGRKSLEFHTTMHLPHTH